MLAPFSSPLNLDIGVVCYVGAPQVANDRQYLNLCALSIGKPYKELWHRSYNGRITKKERDASFKREGANLYLGFPPFFYHWESVCKDSKRRGKVFSCFSCLKCFFSGNVSSETIFIVGIYEGVLPFVTFSVFSPMVIESGGFMARPSRKIVRYGDMTVSYCRTCRAISVIFSQVE